MLSSVYLTRWRDYGIRESNYSELRRRYEGMGGVFRVSICARCVGVEWKLTRFVESTLPGHPVSPTHAYLTGFLEYRGRRTSGLCSQFSEFSFLQRLLGWNHWFSTPLLNRVAMSGHAQDARKVVV